MRITLLHRDRCAYCFSGQVRSQLNVAEFVRLHRNAHLGVRRCIGSCAVLTPFVVPSSGKRQFGPALGVVDAEGACIVAPSPFPCTRNPLIAGTLICGGVAGAASEPCTVSPVGAAGEFCFAAFTARSANDPSTVPELFEFGASSDPRRGVCCPPLFFLAVRPRALPQPYPQPPRSPAAPLSLPNYFATAPSLVSASVTAR